MKRFRHLVGVKLLALGLLRMERDRQFRHEVYEALAQLRIGGRHE